MSRHSIGLPFERSQPCEAAFSKALYSSPSQPETLMTHGFDHQFGAAAPGWRGVLMIEVAALGPGC